MEIEEYRKQFIDEIRNGGFNVQMHYTAKL